MVKDYDAWKPAFDEHDEMRVEMGQQCYYLFQSSDDPNHVVIAIEFDTAENAHAFVDSKDLRERMKEAGVKGKPQISFLELAEQQDLAQPPA
jgi:heme-degrading monooxygenase HmoA